jgi:hypothetical protein
MLDINLEKETGIFIVSSNGSYGIDDLERAAYYLIEEHADLDRIKQLSDFRKGGLAFEWYSIITRMTGLTKVMQELTSTFESVHAAIVNAEDANEGLVEFFMKLRKPQNYHPRFFDDIDEARAWLMKQ